MWTTSSDALRLTEQWFNYQRCNSHDSGRRTAAWCPSCTVSRGAQVSHMSAVEACSMYPGVSVI